MLPERPYTDELTAIAREYIDVHWRHQGRNERGIDCVGLLLVAGWRLGFIPEGKDVHGYPRNAQPAQFMSHFHANLDLIPYDAMHYGDIVVIKISRVISHCGIICKGKRGIPTVIHSEASRLKVVEDFLNIGTSASIIFKYRSGD